MDISNEIIRFKIDLLRKMPFYGDIVMRLPILSNDHILTARTNGGKIEYNPKFFLTLTRGQRNFVLMHEVFHVLLFHFKRHGERNPRLWNTAADMVVNNMLMNLRMNMINASIPFERPADGVFSRVLPDETAENVYERLLSYNGRFSRNSKKVLVRKERSYMNNDLIEIDAPDDLIMNDPGVVTSEIGPGDPEGASAAGIGDGSGEDHGLSENLILQIIRESASANRSGFGSYFIPEQLFGMVESKRIKWQTLLRDFFVEEQSDESSYTTPERKYIHMDMILPGYGQTEEKIEEIWAFVDSSGSIGKNEMEQFLTQLYRISKEFKCVFNICYWDTRVTDVYTGILKEDDVFKNLPKHSGGTDINCVYRWLKDNRVKPDIMLILTDGYFGPLDKGSFIPSLGKKTIIVLSSTVPVNDDMKRMGKIARL